jgi:hypothetical protein
MAKKIEKPGVAQMIFPSFFPANWKIDFKTLSFMAPKLGPQGSKPKSPYFSTASRGQSQSSAPFSTASRGQSQKAPIFHRHQGSKPIYHFFFEY